MQRCRDRPELIEKRLSPEQKKAHRREQAISFVYGNLAIENDLITREMVAKAYDER